MDGFLTTDRPPRVEIDQIVDLFDLLNVVNSFFVLSPPLLRCYSYLCFVIVILPPVFKFRFIMPFFTTFIIERWRILCANLKCIFKFKRDSKKYFCRQEQLNYFCFFRNIALLEKQRKTNQTDTHSCDVTDGLK
jgi:hypothetical protein